MGGGGEILEKIRFIFQALSVHVILATFLFKGYGFVRSPQPLNEPMWVLYHASTTNLYCYKTIPQIFIRFFIGRKTAKRKIELIFVG